MPDPLASSDDVRSAAPLKHLQTATVPGPIRLTRGGTLPALTVAYEAFGTLNADRSNAVLVCHAISGDSHCARHTPDDDPGWWDALIGPGKHLDTDRYCVLCANILGGCRGTTGPTTINPETGQPFGPDFPAVTLDDLADTHTRLLDHLNIDTLHAAIGGSLGGHQAMTLATRHPQRVARCVAIATSARLTAQALAFDVVARNAILRDPHYHAGRYHDQPTRPTVGLAIARMLGHITYLSPQAMQDKFDPDRLRPHDVDTNFEAEFSVGSYLAHQGDKFTDRFDANSYLLVTRAMDRFDLGESVEALSTTLAQSTCDWTVVSFSSDWLFTPRQSRDIVDALTLAGRRVTYCEVPTDAGHDAFLLDPEVQRFGPLVRAALEDGSPVADAGDHRKRGPRSIFSPDRLDYTTIVELIATIAPGASVLDVGCGPGGLLAALRDRSHTDLQGIEVNEPDIVATASRGLAVIDHDLNLGLSLFPDQRFDVSVLSQTLQAIVEVDRVLDEMLRVARRAVVAFPNFGYEPLRKMLHDEGLSPKAAGSYAFEWHNTPNRRFPTIRDFDRYCATRGIAVERAEYLDTNTNQRVTDDPNRHADTAVYVLTR